MDKRKKIIIIVATIIVLFVLFLPLPAGTATDGGSRVYSALTYKIIVWHKLVAETNNDGNGETAYFYNKTSVFWIPDKFKNIDELWQIDFEKGGFEKELFSN
ncbi:MAG: hypothetical protein IKP88_16195 [Lachnospiraceae bacterium]|nr:hypothetical protein [Lachnospiraceae bacterium]